MGALRPKVLRLRSPVLAANSSTGVSMGALRPKVLRLVLAWLFLGRVKISFNGRLTPEGAETGAGPAERVRLERQVSMGALRPKVLRQARCRGKRV